MSELRYQDNLAMRWQALAVGPGPAELERIVGENERLLHLLPGLESVAETSEDEGSTPRYVQQLELRLQLLTDLLGELLARNQPLPPRRLIVLSPDEISWQDDAPPAVNERVLVELFLHEALPRPIRLPAVVHSVAAAGTGFEVAARLQSLGETVTTQIEKLIFRQHRRLVARERGRS